jgi:GntR family transcriptional regulator
MTISKAYSLLEAEGLLERNRGKPMTVAQPRRDVTGLAPRLRQVEPQVEALVLAAKQLQLSETEIAKLLKKKWEDDDDRSDSGRPPHRQNVR